MNKDLLSYNIIAPEQILSHFIDRAGCAVFFFITLLLKIVEKNKLIY